MEAYLFTKNEFSKIVTVFALSVFLFSSTAFAQFDEPRIGIKGGLNLSNLYVDDVEDENTRIGFHAGLTAWLPITDYIGLQPELLYSTKGAQVSKQNGILTGNADFRLNYIDLPLIAVFKLGDIFNLQVGAYGSYLINAKLDIDTNVFSTDNELSRKNFNSVDYGLVGGFGLNFSGIGAGLRYNYGLRDIGKEGFGNQLTGLADSKNSVFQLYLSLGL